MVKSKAQTETKSEPTGIVSLEQNTRIATVGRPKSGKPWKKCSKRGMMNKPHVAPTFQKRMEEASRMKEMK